MNFLPDHEPREVALSATADLSNIELYIGRGQLALEVVVAEAGTAPTTEKLRKIWNERSQGRAAPLLVVIRTTHTASICGPGGEQPPVFRGVELDQARRLCSKALDAEDRHQALLFLTAALPSLESELPGVNNQGLFSDHELMVGARRRSDWSSAETKAARVLGHEDEDLLRALGFDVQRVDSVTSILKCGERHRAVAVLLDDRETPEGASDRFQAMSPMSWALNQAENRGLPWVVMIQGGALRLCSPDPDVGVGRRGGTSTWLEIQTDILRPSDGALLWLLFSAEALDREGSAEQLLQTSRDFSADLAERLRERIYNNVMPALAAGVVHARNLQKPSAEDLHLTYEMALTLLFRLLFIAYGEDRDLLPYRTNEAYRHRALKTKAREIADNPDAPIPEGTGLWHEISVLFDAIRKGNAQLGVPPYNGGLFSSDPAVSTAGAALAEIALDNANLFQALRHLLTIENDDGVIGPVDFRALGVREFGTIYEGLLESELDVAEQDLGTKRQKKQEVFVPATGNMRVEVQQGEVYLHNRSGARKATGSYFTPAFAVEHLLDEALEPALTDHLARLDTLDETEAAERFFDFRVADIAMGSGHFLVAAVDRIERGLSRYLAKRPLPAVRRELASLRAAATNALKQYQPEESIRIEDDQLLRRLVARRCIYGVDLNELAVQLARLSIWIHTFVPGLPLSLLDHSLVRGNALVGIATVDEIAQRFEEAGIGLFPVDASNLLGNTQEPLKRLATLADATPKDIEEGRRAMEHARIAANEVRALCDVIVAEKVKPREIDFQFDQWPALRATVHRHPAVHKAREEVLKGLDVFHFPVAFPEVFLRGRPGFDAIIGNPPWEEVTVEEHAFWARHFPGLRALPQHQQESRKKELAEERPDLKAELDAEVAASKRYRQVLTAGFYPGMGTGDPDLYKAFLWRFWTLSADPGGCVGVVLPRSALAAKGSAKLREAIFRNSSALNVTTTLNKGGWMFMDAEHRYTIGLVTFSRGEPAEASIALRGPYTSRLALEEGLTHDPHRFSVEQVISWTSTASLPLLPNADSIEVFAQLRRAPRLDLNDGRSWRARPDRELDATTDKHRMTFAREKPEGFWPVYKGESFDIWEPDRGEYYAWADPETVQERLQEKRLKSARQRRDSAHSEFDLHYLRDPQTLPCFRPRIAFRDSTNRTNSRTVITALVPGQVFLANTAQYFLWPRGDELDKAFLLAVLASRPLDWYARRIAESHVNFFIINPFPIPRPSRADPLWQRAVALAGRLAAPDDRFAEWAEEVGVAWGPLAADEKQDMIEELDAVVAHLYGLQTQQLRHIFETFQDGWDYEEQLGRTLRHFERLKNSRTGGA
ncbi:Eco57I restriction-modification methylase domain-containing protein [Dichotomicrobium thermohalophilum]|uniref:site-specific DNA-methyltransferase (adenine-specific) n=1 Tax=Dichotomicrobium thermohalophilum TaxID=933063 RepID=A0A397PGA8_9HYPH|nr:hypothetical protein [Dichotomicrobium thermohalophilum]RIA47493.1 hypothetical protein BXY53_2046 [Dichotomicrobium thermohalophilum]